MRSLKALGLVSAIASIFLGAIPSAAQLFNGRNYFKIGTTIYVTNVPASTSINFFIRPGKSVTTNPVASACGLVRLSTALIPNGGDERVYVNNSQINVFSLQERILPNCVNGALTELRTEPFKSGSYFYFPGHSPGQPVSIRYTKDYLVKRTPNQCGIVRFTLPRNFEISGNSYLAITDGADVIDTQLLWSEFPVAQVAPKCFSNSNGGHNLFIPVGVAGW